MINNGVFLWNTSKTRKLWKFKSFPELFTQFSTLPMLGLKSYVENVSKTLEKENFHVKNYCRPPQI